jgi:acetyl esterase/lipase
LTRRGLLALLPVAAVGLGVAACADSGEDPPVESDPTSQSAESRSTELVRLTYGQDPSQFGLLSRPVGPVRGVVVVIHGGFWKAQYGVEYAQPLAADLARRGWAAYAPEYRRVGNGGGYPETFDDVHAAMQRLAEPELDLDLSSGVVVIGHSAGGHLALWSAARQRFRRWSEGAVPVRAVLSQAGVADLASAHAASLGSAAVETFVGPPGPRYDRVDPIRQVPLDVPVWCVHAPDDDTVPIDQSASYVAATEAAGGTATLLEVDGGHFGVIDPTSPAWQAQLDVLESLAGPKSH